MNFLDDAHQHHAVDNGTARCRRRTIVITSLLSVIVGQCTAILLGRFYYSQGGNSKWLATTVTTAGFPALLLPRIFFTSTGLLVHQRKKVTFIFFALGALMAVDNMLYSISLLYLSASTFSLICASQLAFTAVLSYFVNSQKFTFPIVTSVVLLTLSAALVGVDEDDDTPAGESKARYIAGILCGIAASAVYALIVSFTQVLFKKVIKKETFVVVLETQIWTSLVATCMAVIGLIGSGEWRTLGAEMERFGEGSVVYVTTLVFTALSWQLSSVGALGMIFAVSSLFSNVVSTVALAVLPIAAVVAFREKMGGTTAIAMLLAVYGFICYVYQTYVDDRDTRSRRNTAVNT